MEYIDLDRGNVRLTLQEGTVWVSPKRRADAEGIRTLLGIRLRKIREERQEEENLLLAALKGLPSSDDRAAQAAWQGRHQ